LVPSFTAPENKRVFNYTLSIALLIGATTYFAQAADLGWSDVDGNQVSYARYVNWVVTFPALALSLGLLSGISWTTIVLNIVLTWFWPLSYLAAAYTPTSYKWGFFAFGTFAYLILAMSTINECREAAEAIGVGRDYIILAGWTNLLWLLYPIAWGLSDGGHVIDANAGFIFFGVLDALLLPIVGVGFLFFSRHWDFHHLQLDFSDYRGTRHTDGSLAKEQGTPLVERPTT
jgi:bacteriorhodopsin